MHNKYGITAEQLIAHGSEIYNRQTIRNFPYWHYVTVACDEFQWDAITAFLSSRDDAPELYNFNAYSSSAAYHRWYYSGDCIYSQLGVHRSDVNTYSPADTRIFLNSLCHEIQHCLVAIERHLGINSINEEEPRAYVTGELVQRILGIICKNWRIGFMAVPMDHYEAIEAVRLLPANMVSQVNTLAALSGIMNAHMAEMSSVVCYKPSNEWTATTYYNGGVRE